MNGMKSQFTLICTVKITATQNKHAKYPCSVCIGIWHNISSRAGDAILTRKKDYPLRRAFFGEIEKDPAQYEIDDSRVISVTDDLRPCGCLDGMPGFSDSVSDDNVDSSGKRDCVASSSSSAVANVTEPHPCSLKEVTREHVSPGWGRPSARNNTPFVASNTERGVYSQAVARCVTPESSDMLAGYNATLVALDIQRPGIKDVKPNLVRWKPVHLEELVFHSSPPPLHRHSSYITKRQYFSCAATSNQEASKHQAENSKHVIPVSPQKLIKQNEKDLWKNWDDYIQSIRRQRSVSKERIEEINLRRKLRIISLNCPPGSCECDLAEEDVGSDVDPVKNVLAYKISMRKHKSRQEEPTLGIEHKTSRVRFDENFKMIDPSEAKCGTNIIRRTVSKLICCGCKRKKTQDLKNSSPGQSILCRRQHADSSVTSESESKESSKEYEASGIQNPPEIPGIKWTGPQ